MPNNFLNTLNLEANLVAKTLNARNPFEQVYDISGGYNTFTYFTNMLNPNGSKQIDSEKYEKAILGNLGKSTQIASNALSGSNLVVNFVDPNYDLFRINDTVADSEKVKGTVIATAPGQVTLAPLDIAWNTAIHYTANMYCKVFFNSSPDRFSTGLTSIYNTPDLIYNYSSLTRDSVTVARKDFVETYVKVMGDYWVHNQQIEMVKNVSKMVEYKFIFSDRNQLGGKSYNGGLIWAIKNRGGTYYPSTSALTETILQNLIQTVKVKSPIATNKLTMLAGADAIAALQGFTGKYIQFAGQYNTFGGGGVKGLSVMKYNWLGIEIDIIDLNLFNDPIMFPEISTITGKQRQSAAFFLIDSTPIPAVGGGTLPAIERFHFGNQEMLSNYVPGMIGTTGGNASSVSQGGYALAASDVDGVTYNVQTDNGIDIADAKAMVYFELVS